jgi:hypothetical protein
MPRLIPHLRPRAALLTGTLALALAACGTPQERCISAATRELRTVERLLAQTDANLARGYAYEEREITRTEWVICGYDPVPPGDAKKAPRPRYCLDDVTDTVRRAVAIDPAVEQRKRDSLMAKRNELRARAEAEIDACRATYPE